MFARNPVNNDFGGRVAFLDLDGRQNSWTGDRAEFIGRNGTLEQADRVVARDIAFEPHRRGPRSLRRAANHVPAGAGRLDRRRGLARPSRHGPRRAGDRSRSTARPISTRSSARVAKFWDESLGKVQVKTPDRALDILVNRWLPYQTLACRVWARSGFYQSSGAYGFRDQLQDFDVAVRRRPAIARAHLLRAASRQFAEGDVQHWWLRRNRSRRAHACLRRPDLAGLCGRALCRKHGRPQGARRNGAVPRRTAAARGRARRLLPAGGLRCSATLFEHCARALDSALKVGAHGLPLMGTGDWNDGMNRVGDDGKGESVWLGWFLYAALTAFAPIAEERGEQERAAQWRQHGRGARRTRWTAPGTAIGIAAPISTMARRSVRSRTANAASIPSRNPGA